MNMDRLTPWLIGSFMLVLVAAVAGWSLGAGAANGKSDAEEAREQGYENGFGLVYAQSHRITSKRGYLAGRKRGRLAGSKTGAREGADIGSGNADIESSVEAAKAADSAASAAESEIAARQPNCGIVAATPSWCPTGDELAAYKSAVQAAREAAEEAKKQEKEDDERP